MDFKQPMKKLELLAPAGNKASFEAALNGGADAIYLGIDKFSARRQADNFSIEELTEIVKKAHIRGVKVYVTFNTIISDEELPEAVESLVHINNAGVDAVIVQDWGVLELVQSIMPGLRIHASTQMNTHNLPMAKTLENKGVKRITLARELSINEIAEICDSTDIDIETFIHGALCFSYSGQCLFSSMVGNRSGNRGLCPQACRMGYSLGIAGEKEGVWPTPGNHLLSTRDLCGIRMIPELARAGIRAVKIEGRMKSPEYVAIVVRTYRHAIDRYLSNPDEFTVSEEEIDGLREVFSRGFTEGYLKGVRDSGLMSYERPSDRGILVGRVTYIDVYTGRLGLQLKHELCIGDEIEVWVSKGGRVKAKIDELYVNDKRVQCAPAGTKAVLVIKEKRHKINTGDRVFRTHNDKLIREAKEIITGADTKKIPINIVCRISINKPVELNGHVDSKYGGHEIKITSEFPAEKGDRKTLSEADVIAQLNRLGNTVYEVSSWDIQVEPGAMVPLGKLNELRRNLVDKLDAKRVRSWERRPVNTKKARDDLQRMMGSRSAVKRGKPILTVDISTTDQALEAIINGADWLYARPGFSNKAKFDFESITGARHKHGVKLALAVGNVLHQAEIESLLEFIRENTKHFDAFITDNFGMAGSLKDFELPVFLDYHTNVFNRLSAKVFRDEGISRICLSPELTLAQIGDIAGAVQVELEALVHGWLEVMTAEHCVPSASKKSCSACKSSSFYIEDQKGFRFPVEQDLMCRSHIYNSHELYLLPNLSNIIDSGAKSIRLLLNRYESDDAGKITALYREAIDLIDAGIKDIGPVLDKAERVLPSIKNTTTGHYFRAVY